MDNAVFGKTMENVKNIEILNLSQQKRRRNYLLSEPNYDTTKFFIENLLAIKIKKETEIVMNKPFHLGLSIQKLSINVWVSVWIYKTKYGENVKLCYMDTDCTHCTHKNRWYLQGYCRRCWN